MLDFLHRIGFKALWSCRAIVAAVLALPLGGCGMPVMSTMPAPHNTSALVTPAATPVARSTVAPVVASPAASVSLPAQMSADNKMVVLAPAVHQKPWLLHLPGIGGERNIDLYMTRGFQKGGFTGDLQIYDWTEHDIGLNALLAFERNHNEAKLIARMITDRFDSDPTAPIYLSCHSGGGGLAVWALEALPPRVRIESLVMIAPALSPGYDLSNALRHVSGKAYVLCSTEDSLVLGFGCRTMGTIDGIKTDAAGRVGFVMPIGCDAHQYDKLISVPYNPEWIRLGNTGNHIGAMDYHFSELVLAPLVLSGTLPPATSAEVAALANRK